MSVGEVSGRKAVLQSLYIVVLVSTKLSGVLTVDDSLISIWVTSVVFRNLHELKLLISK